MEGRVVRGALVCVTLGILLMPARVFATEAERTLDACMTAADDKDWELAIEQCTDALRSNASSPVDMATALVNRCAAYSMRDDVDHAKHDCEAAISLDPKRASAHTNLGRLYHLAGDEDQAIWHFDAAIRLAPDLAVAYNNRAESYWAKGDISKAMADYDTAIRLDPTDATAFTNRGVSYLDSGDRSRAVADFSASLRLRPHDVETLEARGRTYFDLREFDKALADFELALRLQPQNAGLLVGRAVVEFAQGKFAAAARDLSRAADADPDNRENVYVVLWYATARARAGADLAAELAPRAARFRSVEWPGPIVSRLLGEVDDEAVLAAISSADTPENRQRRCVASFFLGEVSLLHGDEEHAVTFFRAAAETGILTRAECTAARVELDRLKS